MMAVIRQLAVAPLILAGLLFVVSVAQDAETYRDVVSNSQGCCGYVSERLYERPFTRLMVDEWTEPRWTENAVHTERWLVSDGKVNGNVRFWRLIKREPILPS
jgi:hypothetical protein